MIIIGVDFHPEFQQIVSVDTETGEFQERRLAHREEAETFYRALGQKVRVGMEASGHARWFERLVAELQFAAIDDVADGRCRQSEDEEWQGTCRLIEGNIERSGVQRHHDPGGAHTLHKGTNIRSDIGDQETAKRQRAQRSPETR